MEEVEDVLARYLGGSALVTTSSPPSMVAVGGKLSHQLSQVSQSQQQQQHGEADRSVSSPLASFEDRWCDSVMCGDIETERAWCISGNEW